MEELWTGKYWVDGRKIYRKVINIGLVPEPSSLGTKTQYETYYNIQNVDYFTSITGMANRPKDKNMWNFFIPSSDDV
ncbi:MAG: hypothetical protein LBQ59_02295 [Candidatus Peribacteria bacterium]|jgi:hypothetical protein|nr:hypothetical protein [Candidatus Peribacteria bacterium]